MIRTENIGDLVKTWSDSNRYIVNDVTGDVYAEALDPASAGRTYHEGDEMPKEEEPILDIEP